MLGGLTRALCGDSMAPLQRTPVPLLGSAENTTLQWKRLGALGSCNLDLLD
jgi:hypothetical protein